MLKRIFIVFFAFLMVISCCACDNTGEDKTQESKLSSGTNDGKTKNDGKDENTPEELTEDFVRAMYMGDLDAFFAHIPEFTYDVLIKSEDLEVAEGTDKGTAVYNFFKSILEEEEEEIASKVTVETKITDDPDKQSYFDAVRRYYIPEGFVTEKDLEKVEDAVFVAFNADIEYENGKKHSMTDFKAALPCVKIDGKWYVDYFYLVMIPVSANKTESALK